MCACGQAFVEVIEQMKGDMFLAPHIRYYMREMRVVAYSQVGALRRGVFWGLGAEILIVGLVVGVLLL